MTVPVIFVTGYPGAPADRQPRLEPAFVISKAVRSRPPSCCDRPGAGHRLDLSAERPDHGPAGRCARSWSRRPSITLVTRACPVRLARYDDVLQAEQPAQPMPSPPAAGLAASATWRTGRTHDRVCSIAACAEMTSCAGVLSATPTPADVDRLRGISRRVAEEVSRSEYSAAIVTDEAGVARCSSAPERASA